jgi:hypothetical protein
MRAFGPATGRRLACFVRPLSYRTCHMNRTQSMGVWVALGAAVGAATGAALGALAVSVGVGVALGALVGFLMQRRR